MIALSLTTEISITFCMFCWGLAGLAFALNKWRESKLWMNNSDGGNGGRDSGPDDPRNPFNIDPDDPGDWWKYSADSEESDKERV